MRTPSRAASRGGRWITIALLGAALSRPSQAVQVFPGQGIEFTQVNFLFPGAETANSATVRIDVDLAALRAATGLQSGFINVEGSTANWVVRNLPVVADCPFPTISTHFAFGTSGTNLASFTPHVIYSPWPIVRIGRFTSSSTFNVGDTDFDAQGESDGTHDRVTTPAPAPVNSGLNFDLDGTTRVTFQTGHGNVPCADEQSVPCALANNQEWLKTAYSIPIPHDNVPGQTLTGEAPDPPGSRAAQFDMECHRGVRRTDGPPPPTRDRIDGDSVATAAALEGKLVYTARNGLQAQVVLEHTGVAGAANVGAVSEGGNTISMGSGTQVTASWLQSELETGSAVELGMMYRDPANTHDDGGHRVEVVGAGTILGEPFVFVVADRLQTPDDRDPDDTRGQDSVEFCYLDDSNDEGRLNCNAGRNGDVHSAFSETPTVRCDLPDEDTLAWNALPGASTYDVAHARISSLFDGSFSSFSSPSGGTCDDACGTAATQYDIGCIGPPPPGHADVWLVRARGSASGTAGVFRGTWDEGGDQARTRDRGASGLPQAVCPLGTCSGGQVPGQTCEYSEDCPGGCEGSGVSCTNSGNCLGTCDNDPLTTCESDRNCKFCNNDHSIRCVVTADCSPVGGSCGPQGTCNHKPCSNPPPGTCAP